MRIMGRRTASRRLTLAEVRDLENTPVELAPSPGPGVALLVTSMILRKTPGAPPIAGSIFVGSNGDANYPIIVDATALPAESFAAFFPLLAQGHWIGAAGTIGDQNLSAVEDNPVMLGTDADLSAVDFELDIDLEILEIPTE